MDTGIDWMYQGSAEVKGEQDKREAEEYLLGKEFTGVSSSTKHLVGEFAESARDEELFLKQRTTGYQDQTNTSQNEVAEANEEFARRMEDPMYLVSQRQKEKLDDFHKKRLQFEKVIGVQHKSKVKKTKRSEVVSDYRSSHKKKKKQKRHRKRSRSRSRSHSTSRSRSTERHTQSRRRSHHNDRSRYSHYKRYDYDKYSVSQERQKKHSDSFEQTASREKRSGYGLQGSSSRQLNTHDIGPDRHALERKRKENESSNRHHRKQSRALSVEEKERQLKAMQIDAQKRDIHVENLLRMKKNDNDHNVSGKALFLSDVASQANNISMKDRLASKRHSIQKVSDLNNFL